jgi:hypothetical protein
MKGGKVIDYNDVARSRHELGLLVRKASDAVRPEGREVSEIELVAHIAQVQRDLPEATRRGELEYAYWILGFKVSQNRWFRAWDRIAEIAGTI